MFSITATARPGKELGALEAIIAEELQRIQDEPPSQAEIDRAVARGETGLVRSLEGISEFGGRADRLNMYNVLTGDPGYLAKDFARIRQGRSPGRPARGEKILEPEQSGFGSRSRQANEDYSRSARTGRRSPGAVGEIRQGYARARGARRCRKTRTAPRCPIPDRNRRSSFLPFIGENFPTE